MVSAYLYDAEGHDREIPPGDIKCDLPDEQLLWVDVERGDAAGLAAAADALGVPALAMHSIGGSDLLGNIERYAQHFQFRLPVAPEHGGSGDKQIDFLVGTGWVLTIRDGDIPFFTAFRDQDKAETLIGKLTAPLLTASLLYGHLESYFEAIGRVEMAIDVLDEAVLAQRDDRLPLNRLAAMRRRVTGLRKRLADQRNIFHAMLRPDFSPIEDDAARQHFLVLERRFERAVDALDRARDSVTSSFELFATKTAQDTNQLVKLLTFATLVLGLIGAVAGIFGMNFQTGFSQTGEHGFWIVVGSTLGVSGLIGIVARQRRWI